MQPEGLWQRLAAALADGSHFPAFKPNPVLNGECVKPRQPCLLHPGPPNKRKGNRQTKSRKEKKRQGPPAATFRVPGYALIPLKTASHAHASASLTASGDPSPLSPSQSPGPVWWVFATPLRLLLPMHLPRASESRPQAPASEFGTHADAPWSITIFSCYSRAQNHQRSPADYTTLFDTEDARSLIMVTLIPQSDMEPLSSFPIRRTPTLPLG